MPTLQPPLNSQPAAPSHPAAARGGASGERYGPVAVLLHWLVAAAVVAQVVLGIWMTGLPDTPRGLQAGWFNLHKSTGIVLFALIGVRLAWRARHAPPPWPRILPRWERHVAAVNHRLLYLCLLLAPASGFLGSSFSRYPVRLFGWPLPRWIEPWPLGKEWMSRVHEAVAWLLVLLVAVHVAAALRHAWRRDGVFTRMTWRRAAPPRSAKEQP